MPLMMATIIALIAYPPSREILFPPAPLALVSSSGGVQKPKAGVLGSTDSATGAPENHKGEAVEAEASNFVNSIASVALASASGKHPQGEPSSEEDTPHDSVPDPTSMAASASSARVTAGGSNASAKHDKSKVPMETAIWTKMRPLMHGLADVADTWERFGNALSPTPPFPEETFRLRLAGVVVPLLAVALFTSSYMFTKGATFGVGFGFFGDPVITRGVDWLNKTYPHWEKLLEIRKLVLLFCHFFSMHPADTLIQLPSQGRSNQRTTNSHPPPYRRSKQGSPSSTAKRKRTSARQAGRYHGRASSRYRCRLASQCNTGRVG